MGRPGSPRLAATLAVGIGAVSCGSIFIRLASAPSLTAAAYRVFWATVLLAPLVAASHFPELALLSRQEWGKLILSGAALALHFALWIASLSYTSVASSVLLVDTTPFFIGLASRWVLGKAPRRVFWFGLIVAFVGCTLVFQEDRSVSGDSMRGNLMAIGGAIAMAIYFLVGASARQKLSLLVYVWPVYASATVFLLLASSFSKTPLTGYPKSTYLFLFLLGLVPQSIGHTSYNWSLRWLSPALVALISLGEPVGASLLAYVILGERVSLTKLFGGAVILLGIYVAAGPKLEATSRTAYLRQTSGSREKRKGVLTERRPSFLEHLGASKLGGLLFFAVDAHRSPGHGVEPGQADFSFAHRANTEASVFNAADRCLDVAKEFSVGLPEPDIDVNFIVVTCLVHEISTTGAFHVLPIGFLP